MAVDTNLKLRAAIADTVNRDDLSADVTAFEGVTIDSQIKRAVATATASIQSDLISRGGSKAMETVDNSLTTTAAQEYIDLPADFGGARAFLLTTDPYAVLEFVDPTTLWTQYPSAVTGKPQKYTLIGNRRAYLRPVPDSTYTTRLVYTEALDALTLDADTNWLLLARPDIYIQRCMVELCIFLENDERLQFWKGLYDQNMNDLLGDDRNVRWAAVPTKPNLQVSIA
jgi:hypothetical protein